MTTQTSKISQSAPEVPDTTSRRVLPEIPSWRRKLRPYLLSIPALVIVIGILYPFVLGAYSYVRPGDAGARVALGRPLADGHLLFAGEACHSGMAGTVAGAWISGQDAAHAAA